MKIIEYDFFSYCDIDTQGNKVSIWLDYFWICSSFSSCILSFQFEGSGYETISWGWKSRGNSRNNWNEINTQKKSGEKEGQIWVSN